VPFLNPPAIVLPDEIQLIGCVTNVNVRDLVHGKLGEHALAQQLCCGLIGGGTTARHEECQAANDDAQNQEVG
jgi:hypothetical protein